MRWILSIILLFLPCIEIWIFVHLTMFMPLSTIFLQCTITMTGGILLIKGENFSLWTLIESELLNKRIPAEEILDDLILWLGGIFLIVPGLLTDAFGIVFFIPTIRHEIIKFSRIRMQKFIGEPPI